MLAATFGSTAQLSGDRTPVPTQRTQVHDPLLDFRQSRQRLGKSWFEPLGGTKPHGDINTKVLADELESLDRLWPAVPKKRAQH